MNKWVFLGVLVLTGCVGMIDDVDTPADPIFTEQPRAMVDPATVDCSGRSGAFEPTVSGMFCFIHEKEIQNVRDLVAALPQHVLDSYTLMESSRSLHQASVEMPRVIMYGTDTRFMVSVSTDPSDPRYDLVEIAELEESTGHWLFRGVDFSDPEDIVFDADDSSCAGCHGSPARPIWGSYPDWPGAFGSEDNTLSEPQKVRLMELRADPNQLDGRIAALELPSEHSILNNDSFHLEARSYGYANTAMNFELGITVADGIVKRMQHLEDWPTLRRDLVRARFCSENTRADLRAVYEAAGLDDRNDFNLVDPVTVAERDPDDHFRWNQGNTNLSDIVVFRTLDDIVETGDVGVIDALAPIEATRSFWIDYLFTLRGSARASFLSGEGDYDGDGEADGYSYESSNIRPQELIPQVAEDLCQAL